MDSLKILFLDDHCEDLEAFIKVLQRKNFFVESIDSVDEAIKKIKEMVFDLMIIDLSMSSCPELEEYNDDDNIFTGIKLVGMVRSGFELSQKGCWQSGSGVLHQSIASGDLELLGIRRCHKFPVGSVR